MASGCNCYLPSTFEVCISLLLRYAPWPFIAVNIWFRIGLYTIPITTSFSMLRAIEMHVRWKPCTKFVVPSIGSMIQVGSLVSTGVVFCSELDSSAMNLKMFIHHKLCFFSCSVCVAFLITFKFQIKVHRFTYVTH